MLKPTRRIDHDIPRCHSCGAPATDCVCAFVNQHGYKLAPLYERAFADDEAAILEAKASYRPKVKR